MKSQVQSQLTKSAVKALKKPDSTFRRLQSTIILFIVLAALTVIVWTTWQIFQSVLEAIDTKFQAHNINLTRTSASIGIQYRSKQSVVDSAENYVHRAWRKVQIPDDFKVSRLLKLRQWKDRKRNVYQGSGTEAANSGW